jgi:uncharacterized protein YbjQ (UPF0145 family)
MITDFIARFKSILGGRVKQYERAIQEGLDDAYAELLWEYPDVKNVRFGTTEMISDGCELIVYGEVEDAVWEKKQKEKQNSKAK